MTKKEFSEKEICKALGLYADFERKECLKALKALEKEGCVYFDKKTKKYRNSVKASAIKGKISGNKRGFAFVIPEDNSRPDIFISPKNLHGAMHNDTVLCRIIGEEGKSDEGEVISIINRGSDTVVGTYIYSYGYGFVEPDDQRYYADIFIPAKNGLWAKSGEKVVVKITDYPKGKKNPEGKVIEVLGNADNPETDILSIIRSYRLYENFDGKTLAAAKKVLTVIGNDEKEKRADYTRDLVITIDGEDARDFDDAISISKKKGIFVLGVHIADVSHYVTEKSPLDCEALKRGTSVYFPNMVLPMLPVELSNGICSLNQGVERLTLSVIMEVDKEGNVLKSEIKESVIKSSARMTYTSVEKMLNGDEKEIAKYSGIFKMIKTMKELADILISKRGSRGSIDFDIPEAKITVDQKGNVTKIEPYPRGISNRIIEEFMILANETVARTCFEKGIPFIYRIHEKPSEEKMAALKTFLNGMGYDISGKDVEPEEFSKLLGQIEGKPEYSLINKVMLRSMMKAKYSPDNSGHFGLASKYYCHFTSPIRRYPDLMIHRIIKKYYLGGYKYDKKALLETVSQASLISSERERLAEEAEREVEDYYKAKYISNHTGEEFEGIISGVTEFGIFVELENTIEGMIRIENLPQDDYQYIKEKYILTGKNNSFRLGGKIKIKVESADPKAGRIDFTIA
jgi:ribonuclease R